MERPRLVRSGARRARVSVAAIITLVGIALLTFLSVFVVYPAVRTSRARRLFQEARNREKTGNAEEAETIYTQIMVGYPDMI